jgi:hypothetical protein
VGFALDIAAYSTSNRDPSQGFSEIEDYYDWREGYEAMALAGDILVPIGAAATLGGLLWLLLSRRDRLAGSAAGRVSVVPMGASAGTALRVQF